MRDQSPALRDLLHSLDYFSKLDKQNSKITLDFTTKTSVVKPVFTMLIARAPEFKG